MRLFAAATLLGCFLPLHAAEPLIIHEWGTFTSLQDEQGRTIGGINTDEERLPEFVHDLAPVAMGKDGDFSPKLIKGRDYCDPRVTMRLETPVIYVHLPAGQERATFDLSVEFRGGILSQFYPLADATVDRQVVRQFGDEVRIGEAQRSANGRERPMRFIKRWFSPDLSGATTSTLTWRGITVGGTGPLPATTSPVWLAPRAVQAAELQVGAERERYLFYRGLGHLDAPLIARRSSDGASLNVSPRGANISPGFVPALWFADLRGDGTAAFRAVPAVAKHLRPGDEPAVSTIATTFADSDYSADRLKVLRMELLGALMADGLFMEEAFALLNTWEASYFKAAGQRLFFLVPDQWTDAVLPLTVSTPATIERAMMGRIEVVSPTQRRSLQRIADGPVSDDTWFRDFVSQHIRYAKGDELIYRPGGQAIEHRMFIENERGLLAALMITPPPDYRAYLAMGRFRDALLWDAQRQERDPERTKFLWNYQIVWAPFDWRREALLGPEQAQLDQR